MGFPPDYATGIAAWGLRQAGVALSHGVSALISTKHEPGSGLARFRDPEPFPHQGFDARSVLVSQTMRQFPEHDMVDAPEDVRREVGELVERRPSHQLAV